MPVAEPRRRCPRRLALLATPPLVFALAFLPFLPALDGEFLNWDDDVNLVENQGFRGLGWTQIRWMFSSTLLGHYIPLTWLSFGVNHALGGMDPWGYHLGNLLLHGANAVMVYVVARRLLAAPGAGAGPEAPAGAAHWGAVFAALGWGVHPLRVESVAWVTERRDVLCGLFFLVAVWAYLWAVQGEASGRRRWLAVSCVAFAAALLSKAMAMTLPAVLLLLDRYPLGRRRVGWRPLVREKAAYWALAAVGAGVAVWAVRQSGPFTGYEQYGPGARVALVAYSLAFYPWKWIWPVGLSPLYQLPASVDPLEPRFLFPLGAVLAVSLALWLVRRRFPGGLAAWIYAAIVLSPVSGVVHAGFQLAHDRYSYLSGMGFAVLAGAGLTWIVTARERLQVAAWAARLAVVAAVLVVAGLSAGAWRQSAIWRDSETLWRAALQVDPDCALCHNNLGAAIVRATALSPTRWRAAEEHFRFAISLRRTYRDPYHNLGAILARQKRYEEAEPVLREYARLAPHRPDGPTRLGMLYVDQGRYEEAFPLLRRALSLDPSFTQAREELRVALAAHARLLVQAGRLAEAEVLAREASELAARAPGAGRFPGRTGETRRAAPGAAGSR